MRRLGFGSPMVALGVAALAAACAGGGGGSPPPAPPDTSPPTVPANLTATPIAGGRASLAWSASTDDVGVSGYEVLRDGAVALSTTAPSAEDAGLAPSTSYCWAVRAFDAAGNRSASSVPACATTLPPPDVSAPVVVETGPADGATIAPDAAFTARFDEAVDPATLAAGFTLRDGQGAVVAAAVTWDGPSLTATLTPAAPLAYLGRYTAGVGIAVTDGAGNPLAAAASWSVRVEPKPLALQRGAGGGFSASCGATRFAFADLDGDAAHHVDAAFVCWGDGVWIAAGDGAGGFGPAAGVAIAPAPGMKSASLTAVAAADLDGDGIADLAVTELPTDLSNSYLVGGSVDVLFNAGSAAFGPPLRLAAGIYPVDLVAAELRGNGRVDLASVERLSGRLSVFLATGGGAFAPAVAYDVVEPLGLAAAPLVPGGPIALVPTSGPVLLGDGLGAFTPSSGEFSPGLYPMDVAAGDLDGDGKLDLVLPNDATDHVTVLFGDGAGGFPRAVALTTGRYPGSVAVADLNGDGWPDLVVALHQNGGIGVDTTMVLLGTGNGEFAPARDLYEQPIAVVDLDGDGRPDLVGMHYATSPAAGYVLDTWLNVTP